MNAIYLYFCKQTPFQLAAIGTLRIEFVIGRNCYGPIGYAHSPLSTHAPLSMMYMALSSSMTESRITNQINFILFRNPKSRHENKLAKIKVRAHYDE